MEVVEEKKSRESGGKDLSRVFSLTRILSATRIVNHGAGTVDEEGGVNSGGGSRVLHRRASKRGNDRQVNGGGRSGMVTSKSSPGTDEVLDETLVGERRKGRRRNPGDSDCLVLLGKSTPKWHGKVYVRKRVRAPSSHIKSDKYERASDNASIIPKRLSQLLPIEVLVTIERS